MNVEKNDKNVGGKNIKKTSKKHRKNVTKTSLRSDKKKFIKPWGKVTEMSKKTTTTLKTKEVNFDPEK